jgi:hypothetical protein
MPSFRKRSRLAREREATQTFPRHPTRDCPDRIRCEDCNGPGWGPMLKYVVWDKISQSRKGFLCEGCMVLRLGRALRLEDMVKCPMNAYHPLMQGQDVFGDDRP